MLVIFMDFFVLDEGAITAANGLSAFLLNHVSKAAL
jgi:hypothetical protein